MYQDTRAYQLVCSINFLIGDVFVADAVLVYVTSLIKNHDERCGDLKIAAPDFTADNLIPD